VNENFLFDFRCSVRDLVASPSLAVTPTTKSSSLSLRQVFIPAPGMGWHASLGVYPSINSFRQCQHPSIWSLRHDTSGVCKGQTPGAQQEQQTAVCECQRMGDIKVYNTTQFKSIVWSTTLTHNRDVLEHRYAAKQHFVHCMWGVHKEKPEWGLRKQLPTVNITCSGQHQVRPQVNKARSHFIQLAEENIAELYDLPRIESATERLEFIDSLLADNKYLISVA